METPKTQTPQTARLARKIRRIREKKKRGKLTLWRVVCETLNIRKVDGSYDHGMAFKIGYEEYEPSGREVRHRLGLRDICTKCRRAFRTPRVPMARQTLSPARMWFNRLKREDQEKILEFSYKQFLNWRRKQ